MKKIKIGMVGTDTFDSALLLAKQFKDAELFSVFDTNKFRINQMTDYAIEKGLYIKAFNNCDDFYRVAPDIVIIGKSMTDYIFIENSFLSGGFCDSDSALDGIAAAKDGILYFFKDGNWICADLSELPASMQHTYLKSGKNPLFAYFMLKSTSNQ